LIVFVLHWFFSSKFSSDPIHFIQIEPASRWFADRSKEEEKKYYSNRRQRPGTETVCPGASARNAAPWRTGLVARRVWHGLAHCPDRALAIITPRQGSVASDRSTWVPCVCFPIRSSPNRNLESANAFGKGKDEDWSTRCEKKLGIGLC
jgi:hypothetical protein